MLADTYRELVVKPFDIKALKCTKTVRDFLCHYLTKKDLIISYAPTVEFGAASISAWAAGGWVCESDGRGGLVPQDRVNFRVIRALFDAGFLRFRSDIRPLHARCATFGWTKETLTYEREIIRAHILNEKHSVTSKIMNALSAHYGVRMSYITTRGLFEVLRLDGESIPKGKSSRTCVLANKDGEPVNRHNDMSILEWESVIYNAAKRAGTLDKPAPLPDSGFSHLTAFIRAS